MRKLLLVAVGTLLVAACGSSADRAFKKAQLAGEKGQFAKAIQLYTEVLKKDPNYFQALVNRGLMYELLPTKDTREKNANRLRAERDYLAAIGINFNTAEVFNNLGALYLEMGRPAQATENLNRAIELHSNYFNAYLNRALVYGQHGRFNEAMTDYAVAQNLNPTSTRLLLNRGLLYFSYGQYPQAIREFTDLIDLDPSDARAYLERGRAFLRGGFYSDAENDFDAAILRKPTYALAYYYMAEVLFMRGAVDDALAHIARSKELNNTYVPTYDLMGDMLALEDPQAATANYLVARKLDPSNATKYNRKMRLMANEAGRKRIVAERFLR